MTPDQVISLLSYWPSCLYLAAWFAMAGLAGLVSLLAVIGLLLEIVGKVFNLYSESRNPTREKIGHEVVSS
jgi:hypothetical protein